MSQYNLIILLPIFFSFFVLFLIYPYIDHTQVEVAVTYENRLAVRFVPEQDGYHNISVYKQNRPVKVTHTTALQSLLFFV